MTTQTFMIGRRGFWAAARYALAIAMLLTIASGFLYPGGTPLDASTHGYSFTHNYLSDLGSTVAFNDARNTAGALLFAIAAITAVFVIAAVLVGSVRRLSTAPQGRPFAFLAGVAGSLVCVGYLGAALAPLDRAFRLHIWSSFVAAHSFPVATGLLAIATLRDPRFRAPATIGWVVLTAVLVGFILTAHLDPSAGTERGLTIQVITQKIMAATVLAVLWVESGELETTSRTLST
jgi:hypothetical membrane protein